MATRRKSANIALSEDQLRDIIKETVTETLTSIGVDSSDPFEMQADFQHLRRWRKSQVAIRGWALMTAITVSVTGVLGMLWLGLKKSL